MDDLHIQLKAVYTGMGVVNIPILDLTLTGFQIPSRLLAIGPLFLLWANQVDIKDSPHCECIRAKVSFRTKKKHIFIFFKIFGIYIKSL